MELGEPTVVVDRAGMDAEEEELLIPCTSIRTPDRDALVYRVLRRYAPPTLRIVAAEYVDRDYLSLSPAQQGWLPFPLCGSTTYTVEDGRISCSASSRSIRIAVRVEKRNSPTFENGAALADFAAADMHSTFPVVAVLTNAERWQFVWYESKTVLCASVDHALGVYWMRELLTSMREDGSMSQCGCPAWRAERLVQKRSLLAEFAKEARDAKEDFGDDEVARMVYLRGRLEALFDRVPGLSG